MNRTARTPGGRPDPSPRRRGRALGHRAASRPSRRASRRRIAASSAGSAWSQPQTCSVPWRDQQARARRAGPSDDRRSSRRGRPSACSIARSTDTTTSPRCGRVPGGSGERGARSANRPAGRPARVRRERVRVGSSGNDRTSVGPRHAHVLGVEPGELPIVGQDQSDRGGPGAPAASSAATIARASAIAGRTRGTPDRVVTSTRHGGR